MKSEAITGQNAAPSPAEGILTKQFHYPTRNIITFLFFAKTGSLVTITGGVDLMMGVFTLHNRDISGRMRGSNWARKTQYFGLLLPAQGKIARCEIGYFHSDGLASLKDCALHIRSQQGEPDYLSAVG